MSTSSVSYALCNSHKGHVTSRGVKSQLIIISQQISFTQRTHPILCMQSNHETKIKPYSNPVQADNPPHFCRTRKRDRVPCIRHIGVLQHRRRTEVRSCTLFGGRTAQPDGVPCSHSVLEHCSSRRTPAAPPQAQLFPVKQNLSNDRSCSTACSSNCLHCGDLLLRMGKIFYFWESISEYELLSLALFASFQLH